MRIRQLDAIRGIAILIVIFHNQRDMLAWPPLQRVFDSGWMGVDLFFVLSGFLITGILLDTKRSEGYLRNFYARRALRIWPLYAAILAFMFVLVPLVRPAEGRMIFERSSPWWSYPFFLQNFLVGTPTNAVGALSVTWSLAIEEQFYLVWPFVVRACSMRQLRWIACLVIGASPLIRESFIWQHAAVYTNLFCRLDGLMAGALLASLLRAETFEPQRHAAKAWWTLAIAAPLALVADRLQAGALVYSLSAAASAAFVYVALFSPQRWLRTVLTNRALVYTGTISYGLYLLHKIPFDVAKAVTAGGHPLLVFGGLLFAAYAMATASWYGLERPVLKLKRLFAGAPRRRDDVRGAALARV